MSANPSDEFVISRGQLEDLAAMTDGSERRALVDLITNPPAKDHDPNKSATESIHSKPCPACGCEPDVIQYLADSVTKIRRGYYCACGAVVVDGLLRGMSGIRH